MDKIAVIIPCYNEERTIANVIAECKKELPDAKVYVYNNNSSDRTAEIAKNCGAIVRNEYKQGKGNVIRRMFREIDAECYLMVDGDDTYSLEKAKYMTDLVLEKHVDMVVGDRLSSTYFTENKRPFHNIGNSGVRWAINKMFKSNIRDVLTGLRAFSYNFVKTFPIVSEGFEIETEMTIHAVNYNLSVENVVIEYRDRPEGSESKLNTFSDGFKVIFKIIQMLKSYRPLLFFGCIGLVLGIAGIVAVIPVIVEYINTGVVPRFPTLIVSGFSILAAIQSVFTGLVLNEQCNRERRDFEYQLISCDIHKRR